MTIWDDYYIFIIKRRRIFGIWNGEKMNYGATIPLPLDFSLGNFISNKPSTENI